MLFVQIRRSRRTLQKDRVYVPADRRDTILRLPG
jgi:hypothetical protein